MKAFLLLSLIMPMRSVAQKIKRITEAELAKEL